LPWNILILNLAVESQEISKMIFGPFINHPHAQNNHFVKYISRTYDALTNAVKNDKIVVTKRLEYAMKITSWTTWMIDYIYTSKVSFLRLLGFLFFWC